MNLKVVVALSIALLISLFANAALGFNVSDKGNQVEDLQSKNEELTSKVDHIQGSLDEAEGTLINNQLETDGESRKVVEDFFQTQFDYNNASYEARFEKIKQYVDDSVYGQLTAAGIPSTPKAEFQSEVSDLNLYLSTDNKVLSGLVLLETVYTIEGVENPPVTSLFQVEVKEVDGKQKIVHLESLGTFSPMTES
ncbi:hypothetical protein SAMN04489762_3408 [Terribacillus saccharophilus]|uniref:Uncharacterized protein n=1 Tax=Terribacillus saccharophilus TaxID=361277 RepID=A0AAX2EJP5_9BACI|nr:hypothetical protein SAMN04489762_3408 [Terribacillus saccharophilus]